MVTISNVKQLPAIPQKGTIYLSVNLALSNPGQVWSVARELGFDPELAYLPTQSAVEIHALLHQEQRQSEHLLEDDFDETLTQLIDAGIPGDAIRFVYGGKRRIKD